VLRTQRCVGARLFFASLEIDIGSTDYSVARKGNYTKKERIEMTTSLQQITDAFGNWVANSNPPSGGMVFSASTDYSRISDYAQYQVTVGPADITYGAVQLPTPTSITSASTIFNNGSDVAQSQSISLSETSTQTFQWSTTETRSVGVTVSANLTIPGIAQIGTSVSTNMTFSTSKEATISKSQTWNLTDVLTIPAHSTVSAKEVVVCQSYNAPWTATCLLSGMVAVWYRNRWEAVPGYGDHFLWFCPIEQMLTAVQQESLIDTTGYTVVGGGVLATTASGTFTGGQGIASQLVLTQTTLPAAANARPLISSYPIGSDGRIAIVGADPTIPLEATA